MTKKAPADAISVSDFLFPKRHTAECDLPRKANGVQGPRELYSEAGTNSARISPRSDSDDAGRTRFV